MRPSLFVLSSAAILVSALGALGTGCDNRLTPDDVRKLLDKPTGTVSNDTMAKVTRDLFQADRATGVEGIASLIKSDNAGGSSNAVPGVSTGVLEDAGDVFCVGGLVASIATFDGCTVGKDCKAELTLDSCLLRVGDPGADEDARGKIHFKLESVGDKSDLALEFNGWQSSHDDTSVDSIEGLVSLETILKHDGENDHAEVVFASDVDTKVVKKEHGFFEDGVTEKVKVAAGLRFLADTTDTGGHGSLEVLSFVDENDERKASVKITLDAEGHQVNAETATASASISVEGENGKFSCTWAAASSDGTPEGDKVSSEGTCTDENGETFNFSGEATSSS